MDCNIVYMATSFYVYSDLKTYNNINHQFLSDPQFHSELIDILIIPFKNIILVTNTNKEKERPNMQRTIIHFRNGVIPEDLKYKAKIVQEKHVFFNYKTKKISIIPRLFRKPLFKVKCDRYYGDTCGKNVKINYKLKFYDFFRDRVNFIVND